MLKKPKILVVGSFMMDLIASTKRAPNSGETVVGLKFQTAPGGKGANQAVQCARLGANVTMVGQVGNDSFGRTMKQTAADSGVDVSNVYVDPDEPSGVGHITLEVTESGVKNRITVLPGANFSLRTSQLSWLEQDISQFDIVLLQLELPMDVVAQVAQYAYSAGVPVMLNPAPAAPLSRELLSHVTYLSPNEHEAALLASHPINIENGICYDDVKAIVSHFQHQGVENLIITMGDNGSIVADCQGIHYTDCIQAPQVVDPTAAGDSFVAAFCTVLSAGLSKQEALVFASYTASLTVSLMGAMPSLPTIEQVQDFMRLRNAQAFELSLLDALK